LSFLFQAPDFITLSHNSGLLEKSIEQWGSGVVVATIKDFIYLTLNIKILSSEDEERMT